MEKRCSGNIKKKTNSNFLQVSLLTPFSSWVYVTVKISTKNQIKS